MAHFEKVRTGHERWTAQWSCAHACTLRMSQSRAGLGAWPVALAFDAGPSQTLPRRRRRRGANAKGARTEAPKAPRGVGPAGLWPGKC